MTRRAALGWFGTWVVVGVGWGISVVSFIGVLTIIPTILATIGLAVSGRQRAKVGAPGLPVGMGLLPLFVAFLNRAGPGVECTRTATGESCTEHLDPLPWLVAGLALLLIGFVAFGLASRASAGSNGRSAVRR